MQVLAEGEQIRKEADNIGPRAELEHWKKRTSKFNFLLEQLKSQRVRAVTGILQSAKSKLLPVKMCDKGCFALVHLPWSVCSPTRSPVVFFEAELVQD